MVGECDGVRVRWRGSVMVCVVEGKSVMVCVWWRERV